MLSKTILLLNLLVRSQTGPTLNFCSKSFVSNIFKKRRVILCNPVGMFKQNPVLCSSFDAAVEKILSVSVNEWGHRYPRQAGISLDGDEVRKGPEEN